MNVLMYYINTIITLLYFTLLEMIKNYKGRYKPKYILDFLGLAFCQVVYISLITASCAIISVVTGIPIVYASAIIFIAPIGQMFGTDDYISFRTPHSKTLLVTILGFAGSILFGVASAFIFPLGISLIASSIAQLIIPYILLVSCSFEDTSSFKHLLCANGEKTQPLYMVSTSDKSEDKFFETCDRRFGKSNYEVSCINLDNITSTIPLDISTIGSPTLSNPSIT